MNLTEDEYSVLKMLIEDGWRLPCDAATETFLKPRRIKTVPGGNETLMRLRQAAFLDNQNRITVGGRKAFKAR